MSSSEHNSTAASTPADVPTSAPAAAPASSPAVAPMSSPTSVGSVGGARQKTDSAWKHVNFEIDGKDEWWRTFGHSAPNLQKLAIRILGQTSSSSGCERNWSVFERIHNKRRNRLEHQRLNDLVYVQYNLRLKNRDKYKKRSYDPVDYECIDKTEFWIVEDEEDNTFMDYDDLERMLYDNIEDLTIDTSDQHLRRDDNVIVDREENEDIDFTSFDVGENEQLNIGDTSDNDDARATT
ncbi:uncharacterized protein LOC120009908 [Tripterygium wilfordii]|uniref:uncharacterized protein LOC120009908 n=1 Tax=Tripterygium wilfordii TaxID=458696 RepID=UPI0018F81932|nr:uncharacterized protein LOC120009908 [Tripterygium wilfordii]